MFLKSSADRNRWILAVRSQLNFTFKTNTYHFPYHLSFLFLRMALRIGLDYTQSICIRTIVQVLSQLDSVNVCSENVIKWMVTMVSCAHSSLHVSTLDTDPYTAQWANELWIQTAAVDDTAFVMGKLRPLDALIRRILPVRLDAPDADRSDYDHWSVIEIVKVKVTDWWS